MWALVAISAVGAVLALIVPPVRTVVLVVRVASLLLAAALWGVLIYADHTKPGEVPGLIAIASGLTMLWLVTFLRRHPRVRLDDRRR